MMNHSLQYKIAVKIAKKLTEEGFIAYFAGGCVRDFVMGIPPKDFDIATTAKPDQVEKLFQKTVPVGKQFGVILVVEDGETFEVATFRQESGYLDGRHPSEVHFVKPEEDAKRRDFTINGMFYDPKKKQIIDFVNGQADIQSKVVRTIGNPHDRFQEDKLRLLRAVRFASNLGFTIESETWNAIKKMAAEIKVVSQERIRDELIKLFTRSNAGLGLALLSDSGLLAQVLPEIEAMKGVEQSPDYHPEGDVFIHTKLLLDKLDQPSVTLAFGALLHDVGKPSTFAREGSKITFYTHEKVGGEIAQNMLKRLRFSNRQIEDIIACVQNHMKFAHVKEMRSGKLKQFVSRPTFQDELELHRIDCSSSHGMLDNYYFLQEKTKEYEKEDLKPKPLIDGNDIMALGVKPGPLIKEILLDAYTNQLEGKWKTKEEAIEWVKRKHQLPKAT